MSSGVVSIIGIIVGLVIMIILAYRGVHLLICTPIASVIVAAFSMQNPITMLSGAYMTKFCGFMQSYFLLFMFSAMFGALMGITGSAKGIAKAITKLCDKAPEHQRKFWGVIAMTVISLVLGYGGINGFVIVYTITAINRELCKNLDLPWHLSMLNMIAGGLWVQGFLPGSPSIQNLIPMTFLGTSPTAGAGIGIVCSLIATVLWLFYVKYDLKKAEKAHEGYLPTGAEIEKVSFEVSDANTPGIVKSLIPSIVLLVTLNVVKWNALFCLIVASVVAIAMFWPAFGSWRKLVDTLADGAKNSVSAVSATCACVGFGGVVAAVSGYQTILAGLTKLPGPPIFQFYLAVMVAAGATGSGSGGLTIALNSLGQRFLDMGINPQVMHRIGTMACCSLDTLPHNGAIVNTLMVSRLTHKQGYTHVFMISVVITTICGLIGVALSTAGLV